MVTVGVNICLDWSSWVTEVLSDESAHNATFIYYRTQLNESGSVSGRAKMLSLRCNAYLWITEKFEDDFNCKYMKH